MAWALAELASRPDHEGEDDDLEFVNEQGLRCHVYLCQSSFLTYVQMRKMNSRKTLKVLLMKMSKQKTTSKQQLLMKSGLAR
jgi:hypothetical protein